jgi:hypothetical protein
VVSFLQFFGPKCYLLLSSFPMHVDGGDPQIWGGGNDEYVELEVRTANEGIPTSLCFAGANSPSHRSRKKD